MFVMPCISCMLLACAWYCLVAMTCYGRWERGAGRRARAGARRALAKGHCRARAGRCLGARGAAWRARVPGAAWRALTAAWVRAGAASRFSCWGMRLALSCSGCWACACVGCCPCVCRALRGRWPTAHCLCAVQH